MARMSFHFTASGTREECQAHLNGPNHNELSSDGQVARGLVLGFLADAPASGMQEHPVRYAVSASGHRDPHRGGHPYLSVSLQVLPAEANPATE